MCECVCALSALVGGAAGGLWEPEQPVPRCGDSKAGAGQPRLNAPNLQPSFFTDFNRAAAATSPHNNDRCHVLHTNRPGGRMGGCRQAFKELA